MAGLMTKPFKRLVRLRGRKNPLIEAAGAIRRSAVDLSPPTTDSGYNGNNSQIKEVDSNQTSNRRRIQCRYERLNEDDFLLIQRLSQDFSLEDLLTIGHRAVFTRVVEMPTEPPRKTTAKDLVVLLSAIQTKNPTGFDRLIPICEVLTALIRDLSTIEILHLSDALSSLRLHHQPLAEAIADTLNYRLRRGQSPIITPKNESNVGRGLPPSPINQLFDLLFVSRRVFRGLATQRAKDHPIIAGLCENVKFFLRNLPWVDLPSEYCAIGAEQLAWIINQLAKLDRLAFPGLAPLLNENLKFLAKNGYLSISSFALWGEALLLSELDRFEVYQKTLLEISIRLTPLLDNIQLPVFFDQSLDPRHHHHSLRQRVGRDTHRRLLSCIYGIRYFHHDSYDLLPASTKSALERIQNVDPLPCHPNKLSIKTHMITVLRRLRVAHYTNVMRGPLMTDILERDRNCVWFCNTSTSFYTNSRERTAVHRFRQRLLQSMGYNVASVAFWQWSRLKSLRARLEYVRMARYYALRDRREFDPEFEGWSLPYLDLVSRQAYSVQSRGNYFPNFQPLGHKEY